MTIQVKDHGDAFDRPRSEDGNGMFSEFWPSATRGDGKIRVNNSNTGAYQGKGTLRRKAPCRLCGMLNDLNKIDHTGGDEGGDGAGGVVTKTTKTVNYYGGSYTLTEKYGDQAARKNAGCALCFSKNSTTERIDQTDKAEIYPIPPLGF